MVVNGIGNPLKPHLPHIGRFLLVVTFIEDAFRILMQWKEQLYFMQTYRHIPMGISHLFLLYNVLAMLIGSWLALTRISTALACSLLTSVIVIQSLGYGLLSNVGFMLRNLSLLGGLILMLNEPQGKQKFNLLPSLSESEKGTYFSLLGRILLICLTGSLLYNGMGHSNLGGLFKICAFALALVSSFLVAIGFKARYSAVLLVSLLSLCNVIMNNWWSYHLNSPERDYMRYDFFQTLSIIGGFLLLVHSGPGNLSIDQKKKDF